MKVSMSTGNRPPDRAWRQTWIEDDKDGANPATGFTCSNHRWWLSRLMVVSKCLYISAATAQPAAHWVSIRHHPEFADVRSQLQTLVDMNGHGRENKICVVGQKIGSYLQAEVYWPAENKLILWRPNRDDPQAIVDSKRYLDLTHDVVAGNDVHGSNYLLTRGEADEAISACRSHGETFAVDKSTVRAAHG